MKVFIIIKKGEKFYAHISKNFKQQHKDKIKWNSILRAYIITLEQAEFNTYKKAIEKI